MSQRPFADKIISWYHQNKRDLPWRHTTDPYKIWLSEVILQQTRVDQGMPYYLKFIEEFPRVQDLANALEDRVLRVWQGLGYYSRARNLHACAKKIVSELGGNFPQTADDLQKLPGIGPYTSAAIASFAFKQPVAVVDGNVFRVLSRVFGINTDILSPQGKRDFQQLADELLDTARPDAFNQAVMEFGALQCTPHNPTCATCPFHLECYARQHQMQGQLPVKKKKAKVRKRYFHYIVIEHGGQLLMNQRGGGDIWQGLYDFPLVETDKPEVLAGQIQIEGVTVNMQHAEMSKSYRHLLSHQQLITHFYLYKATNEEVVPSYSGQCSWYDMEAINHLPKPVLISAYLNEVKF